MPDGILTQLERKFGLPSLSKVAESLERFPDAKQLRLIRDVLTVAERLSEKAPELDKVLSIIQAISSMPTEQLKELDKVLRRVERVMKQTPEELLGFLASLKGE